MPSWLKRVTRDRVVRDVVAAILTVLAAALSRRPRKR